MSNPRRKKRAAPARSRRPRLTARTWTRLSDKQLLNVRLCDLDLSLKGTEIERRVDRLRDELATRGLNFQPHVWLSSEWFTPDNVPGIAIPFYLSHERLMKLERNQMLEVEGAPLGQCMRILRHEAGHAIDNAFRLHFKPSWRRTFGLYSERYPKHYKPKPFSRNFVVHLDMWYAQSHPAEDFAETFAVWLAPNSRWRSRYHGWPAQRKLEYVDELMGDLEGIRPPVRTAQQVEPLHSLRITLRDHYHAKKMHYAQDWPDFYDRDLQRLFSNDRRFAANPTAASFLREVRPKVRRMVAKWTGAYEYTIDQVLIDMIDRCRELKLRLAAPVRQARVESLMLVAVQTMNYLHEGHHLVAL